MNDKKGFFGIIGIVFIALIFFVVGGLFFNYIKEDVFGCCMCGSLGRCCPCVNQDTHNYFQEKCTKYKKPISSSDWFDICKECNEELNMSLDCFQEPLIKKFRAD